VNVPSAVGNCQSILLDSAPIIYWVENHPDYGPVMKSFFDFCKE